MDREENIFDNTQIAFEYKNDDELKKAIWIFRLIGYPWLVRLGSRLTLWAVENKLPVRWVLKNTLFSQFCGGENLQETLQTVEKIYRYNVESILDYGVEGKQVEEEFDRTASEIKKNILLSKQNKAIPFAVFKPTGLIRFSLLEKLNTREKLSKEEEDEWTRARERFISVCKYAYENNVSVFVDAEESWIQTPVDNLVEECMLMFNKSKPVVYNTLQMYHTDRLDYLKQSIEWAKRNNIYYGVKLVRGAYMEKERERAEKLGYKSPIHPFKEATDNAFNQALHICVENRDVVAVCNATHNEKSCLLLIELMKKNNVDKQDPNFYFAQLYGMSDHISFNLADRQYRVAKYLPYGPVEDVVPYLIRRAQENTSVAGQQSRELSLLLKEWKRRKQTRNKHK